MATSWEKIETQAMTYIKNDLSLDYDLKNRLAVFYNRMAAYMEWSIGMFDSPPEIAAKLEDCVYPDFDDMEYAVGEDQDAPATIETGYIGYDVCSCGVLSENSFGEPEYTPLNCIYDSATGDVIINADLTVNQVISINFYKSGQFNQDLNKDERKILAYGIYAAWEHRFDNDSLERMSKIRDSSFTTISEASQTSANTARQKLVMQEYYSMLHKYEQNRACLEVQGWKP